MDPTARRTEFVQQLMDFRTSYLRGLSRATVDLGFRKALTTAPLATLKEAFNYTCPWFLNLVLHDDSSRAPRINLAQGCIMTLPYWGESITVYIPKKPALPPEQLMDAIGAYYHENQWFLHNKFDDPCGRHPEIRLPQIFPADVLHPPAVYEGKWTSVNMDRDRNERFDLGVSFDDFISFAAALFNAVALSWGNDEFRRELTSYTGGAQQPRRRTVTLLEEWLGYKYPWQLDLIIQEDEHAHFNVVTGQWDNATPPALMLTIPWMTGSKDPITEVAENRAHPSVAVLGVALYNTDGPGYPFTCG